MGYVYNLPRFWVVLCQKSVIQSEILEKSPRIRILDHTLREVATTDVMHNFLL
jgi:hypothetical protein